MSRYFLIKLFSKIIYENIKDSSDEFLKKIINEKRGIYYYEYYSTEANLGSICLISYLLVQFIFWYIINKKIDSYKIEPDSADMQ